MAPSTRLTLHGSLDELVQVAEAFEAFAAAHGLSDDVQGIMQLALEETIVNVIKHGYGGLPGPIVVDMTVDAGEVTITIADSAAPFNPLDAPAPRLDAPLAEKKPGGLGIHLVKSMMDSVVYQRVENGNRLTMRKRDGNP